MKLNLFIKLLVFSSVLLSCSQNTDSEFKTEYYSNGEIKSKVPLIKGVESGTEITYYENGTVKSEIAKMNDKKHGYSYSYYPSGILKSIKHYNDGVADGSFVWFYENGAIEKFNKYLNDTSMSFTNFDSYGNLIKGSPAILVENTKDTIKLGETFSAIIKAIYPAPEYSCDIYVRKDSTAKDGNLYEKIGDSKSAIYKATPRSEERRVGKECRL